MNFLDPVNWVGDLLPASNQTASIGATGTSPTISIAGTTNIGVIESTRTLKLDGGTLTGATLTITGGAKLQFTTNSGTLNGVTSNADLDLSGAGVAATVTNGLTLNGIATIGGAGNYNRLEFVGSQTLGGSGTVILANGTFNPSLRVRDGGTTLTIGPNMTVRGGSSSSGQPAFIGTVPNLGGATNVSVINQGTISADISGQTIRVGGSSFTNSGTASALNGGVLDLSSLSVNSGTITATGSTLSIGGTWSNAGTINETNSTLNFGGSFTTAGIGTFNRTGGTVNITGTLNNAAATLALTAATGSWSLAGGTITGGTLTASGGAKLLFTTSSGTLDGLTSNADLDLTGAGVLAGVINGLTLNGVATIGGAGNYNRLEFVGSQTLGGSGTVILANGTFNPSLRVRDNGTTLTIGPNMTVRGGASGGNQQAFIGYVPNLGGAQNVSVINQGTISADVSGQVIRVGGSSFTNSGTASALNGGVLDLSSLSLNSGTITATGSTLSIGGTWSNAGTINETNSTLNFGGSFTTAGIGTFNRTGGTVNITGTLNNAAATLALTAATGSWSLAGGTITGGTLTASGGAKLLFTTSGGTLDGLTSNADLDLTGAGVAATVVNGLTLNGIATIGGAGNYNRLEFAGTQTLGGSGSVVLANGTFNPSLRVRDNGTTLTIGSNMTVHGGSSSSGQPAFVGYVPNLGGAQNVSVINQGTISADVANQTIRVGGASFTNSGTASALNGGVLDIQAASWSSAVGTLTENNSTLNLGGVVTTAGLHLATFTRTGGTVNIAGTVTNTAATLALTAATGSWSLAGGTITGGTLTASGAAKLLFTTIGGTLDGLTSNADLDLTGAGVAATVINGLTLNGIATIGGAGNYNRLEFGGTQTLGGSGSVVLANGTFNPSLRVRDDATTLTIGPSMTVRGGASTSGQGAFVGYVPNLGGAQNVSVINLGTISADVSGQTIRVGGAGFTNSGTASALNGGVLDLQAASWSSAVGTLTENNSTLNLGGVVTTAGLHLATFTRTGGTVNITGTLNNAAATLALTAATGSWSLAGGTITGGTLTASGGAKLLFTTSGGTLDGLISNADLDLSGAGVAATVTNGLTLNGIATIGGAGNYNRLEFAGSQTLGGSGTVILANGTFNPSLRVRDNGTTLTIGPNMTVRGGASGGNQQAFIGYVPNLGGAQNVSVINQGTISADIAGQTIRVGGASFTNSGTASALNGGVLDLSILSNFSAGTLTGGTFKVQANGIMRLEGVDISTNAANIVLDGANSFIYNAATGTVSALAPLASNAAAGSLSLLNGRDLTTAGGFANGGAVVLSPGSVLSVTGAYSQTAAGSFTTQITSPVAGTGFGQITASGADTLAGTLNVSLLGGYLPTSPDGYRVLNFASRSGDFTAKNGLLFTGGRLNPLYDATGLTLDANFSPDAVTDAATMLEDNAVTFNVLTNDNDPDHTDSNPDLDPPALFTFTQPLAGTGSVASNGGGSFTYTPPADFNGAASFTYTIKDVAGNTDAATVNLTITPVNDAPQFTLPTTAPTVNEDSGAQTVNTFVTGIRRGPTTAVDEVGQVLTFNPSVTGTTGGLTFTTAPTINPATGALTYTAAANSNGTATVSVTLSDNGGTANGGVDTSTAQTFTITVNPINDAPTIAAIANQTTTFAPGGTRTVTITGLATGPANESGQTLTLSAVSDNASAVASTPTVVNNGNGTATLTYTTTGAGIANITVTATDNGGTANGGVNLATRSFAVQVNSLISARRLFYNDSALDGNNAGAGASDDAAIASDKSALLPGGVVSAANVTGFSKGINGIMIDVAGLTAGTGLTVADFSFRAATAGSWAAGPVPSSVTVRRGITTGVDRITLIWNDPGVNKALVNGWLEVTVKATANTGLATADVFAFGNLVGDANGDRSVTVGDLGILSTNFNKPSGATIAQGDFNGDGAVTVGDLGIMATAFNRTLAAPPALGLLVAGSPKSTATASVLDAPVAMVSTAPSVATPARKSSFSGSRRIGH